MYHNIYIYIYIYIYIDKLVDNVFLILSNPKCSQTSHFLLHRATKSTISGFTFTFDILFAFNCQKCRNASKSGKVGIKHTSNSLTV